MKIKKIMVLIMATMFISFLCCGVVYAVLQPMFINNSDKYAQTSIPTSTTVLSNNDETLSGQSTQTPPVQSEGEPVLGVEGIAESFVEWLKSEYGADYQHYYDMITEKWGSIEAYLTQFGEEHFDDEVLQGWYDFLDILNQYAPVWISALALILLVIAVIVSKKIFGKIINSAVENRVNKVIEQQKAQTDELNRQSATLVSLSCATEKLLGNSDRFAAEKENLLKSAEDLKR